MTNAKSLSNFTHFRNSQFANSEATRLLAIPEVDAPIPAIGNASGRRAYLEMERWIKLTTDRCHNTMLATS